MDKVLMQRALYCGTNGHDKVWAAAVVETTVLGNATVSQWRVIRGWSSRIQAKNGKMRMMTDSYATQKAAINAYTELCNDKRHGKKANEKYEDVNWDDAYYGIAKNFAQVNPVFAPQPVTPTLPPKAKAVAQPKSPAIPPGTTVTFPVDTYVRLIRPTLLGITSPELNWPIVGMVGQVKQNNLAKAGELCVVWKHCPAGTKAHAFFCYPSEVERIDKADYDSWSYPPARGRFGVIEV